MFIHGTVFAILPTYLQMIRYWREVGKVFPRSPHLKILYQAMWRETPHWNSTSVANGTLSQDKLGREGVYEALPFQFYEAGPNRLILFLEEKVLYELGVFYNHWNISVYPNPL